MTEQIPLIGEKKEHIIKFTDSNINRLDDLSSEPKERIKATITLPGSEREKIISLIRKTPRNFAESSELYDHKISNVENYLKIWEKLKEVKIPTIPNVYKISDTEVVMTDLTANGSGVYDKDFRCKCASGYDAIKSIDKKFLEIDLNDIREKTERIAETANNNNIALPEDGAFNLIVHPNGSWKIIVLDIGETQVGDVNPEYNIETLNQQQIDVFMDCLEFIRKKMKDS